MKRKGFTLIELLGVIIILGILSMITFPIILNQIRNAKQGIKESTKTLIIDAAKDYYEDNINNYDKIEGMTYCIDINTLTDNNYLNKKIKDEKLNDIDTTQKVKMIYHNSKFDYEVVDSCTYYTVTFDANGGSVDIDSKEVIEKSAYGTLPTPTRAGYTFMGWNGKNMFDEEATPLRTYAYISGDGTETSYGEYAIYKIDVKPNATYTITNSGKSNAPGYAIFNSSGTIIAGTNYTNREKVTFTTPATASYMKFSVVNYSDSPRYDKEIFQIEEGTEATPYEPYYITPETKVVQEQNHTLKAIWKAN